MIAPDTYAGVAEAVRSQSSICVIGGGTKPALARPPPGCATLSLEKLSDIVEYDPAEFTFTAQAGTPLAEIQAELARHGQYLPFDPPFGEAGATLGGAIASGLSGPRRYRFGGVRDFILGVRFVTGLGELARAGGKVVKNAAGFDLPKLMVGSLGRLGVIVEISCKVFPEASSLATLAADVGTVGAGVDLMGRLAAAPFDLESVDLLPPGTLALRIGGAEATLTARLAALERFLGRPGNRLLDSDDRAYWEALRQRRPALPDEWLVKVPLDLSVLPAFDAALEGAGAVRHYSVGGQVAWVRWTADADGLQKTLEDHRLAGLLLAGPGAQARVGTRADDAFGRRVKAALDPESRFPSL